MKDNMLLELSREIAVEIINVANKLRSKREASIADQIKRSGTSISANIAEANHPQSRLDMISKFEIALKEANETENWLNILQKSDLIDINEFKLLHKKVVKIKILLISSIKTLKNKIS
jgi:four helix bundle protein